VRDDSQHQKDLDLSVDSEVLGEALFGTAARIVRSHERREKWSALAALEAQTMKRLDEYLSASAQSGSAGAAARFRGQAMGVMFALLPWRAAMKALGDGTARYLAAFRRLETGAQSELDRSFFEYLVAHEVAIRDFAQAELSGASEGSLAPIHALLRASG